VTLSAVLPWLIFSITVFGVLALDLGVFHRKSHAVSVKEAAIWTAVWVALAMSFAVGIYFMRGSRPTLEFLTGYVVEYSLSVDNIFVFVLIFTAFRVPAIAQHRVLFWGILAAFAMRGAVIGIGAALINSFHWILYIFGVFLIYTGIKLIVEKNEVEFDANDTWSARFIRKHFRMTAQYDDGHFVVLQDGRKMFTPLMLVLVVVNVTDLIFAADSIPAVFAVTQDGFIVFTSNVFAILGLRSLYFLLAGIVDRFYYLKPALAVILTFVGIKMVIVHWFVIPISASLTVIVGVLVLAIMASYLRARHLENWGDYVPDPRQIPEDHE
jgi:tellurite resistance protein TerC